MGSRELAKARQAGIEPKWVSDFHRTLQEQAEHLDSLLDLIVSEGYAHSEIAVLSRARAHGSAAQTLTGKWASRMRPAAGRLLAHMPEAQGPAHDSSRIQGTGVPCRHRDRYRQSC